MNQSYPKNLDGVKRFPRPKGTSSRLLNPNPQASKNKRKNQSTRTRQLIINVIKDYMYNDFMLNGEPTSIPKLAQYIGITESQVQIHMAQQSSSLARIFNSDRAQEICRAAQIQVLSASLGDRGRVLNQLQIMLNSQGDRYKPFISSEVNHSLNLLLRATKNTSDVLGQMMGGQGTSINILNQVGDQNNNYLTIDKAASMITEDEVKKDGTDMPNLEEKYAHVYTTHQLSEAPDTHANAVPTPNIEEMRLAANKVPKDKLDRHLTRREEGMQVFSSDDHID